MIRLFEIEEHVVKPTEHCHIINWLKVIMDNYPDNYLKIYAYIFYMACPSQENPYYNVKLDIREDVIKNDIQMDFNTEDDLILEAVQKATQLYETPTVRMHKAIITMLDNITDYMSTAAVTSGRDGNLQALTKLAKEFDEIRQSYKGIVKDLEDEQQTMVRGKQDLAYDQS